MRNAGLDEAQAGIKIARRNINNLTYADDMILYIENPKDSTRKLLELINEYSKVSGYKGNGNPVQCSCLENPRHGSLVSCRLWGCTESDTTEET